MAIKLFLVTNRQVASKKQTRSRAVGFVSIFGWESERHAEKKAQEKYPGFPGVLEIHEKPRGVR